ncbi:MULTISPECIES: alpha/beta hydrolase [Solibacillus]|uniref:Alpha/beta hydrolase n=1 Tax=Solibacillus merdavium TaxID=2762218 RepID=A0ABR8XR42_9BACL|nr:alpha/beta hydrolase [Solibacillus merdavium]MBD8034409.1 alpha/beta hydrolase [Solibacillus merdavium]
MKGLHPELAEIFNRSLKNARTFHELIANRTFTHFSEQNFRTENCLVQEMMINNVRVICLKPKQAAQNMPCFVWFHGGGMVFGNPDDSIPYVIDFVHNFQAVVFIPQYRLAPEHPYPAALEDSYETLTWIYRHANALNIDPNKIIVSGGSAGGNLALAVALKARDEKGPQIAGILPLYPMLDAKERPFHEKFASPAIWNNEKNRHSWDAYLGNMKIIPPYASPLYANVERLPPIYTFIGTHDLFYEEVYEFVNKLRQAHIDVQFDIYKGCIHGFDLEEIPIAREAKKRLLYVTAKLLNGHTGFGDLPD